MAKKKGRGERGSYRVGRNKPPGEHRFAPGVSGNPRGRPKGAKNFATALRDALEEKIPVIQNGVRRIMTKRAAAAVNLVNKAVAGNERAMALLMTAARDFEPKEVSNPENLISRDADEAMWKRLLERVRQVDPPTNPDEPTSDEDAGAGKSDEPADQ